MRRDMDIIHALSLQVEASDGSIEDRALLPDEPSRALVTYNAWLLIDAGVVTGHVANCTDGSSFVGLRRLTWSGQDFLAAARDNATLKEAMQRVCDRAGDVSLQVLTGVLSAIALQKLGLGR